MTDRMGEKGKIATRRCPTCGHHEVGFVDAEGVFRPLTPGQPVVLLEGDGAPSPAKDIEEGASEAPAPEPPMSEGDLIPWVPEPLRGNRALRLVFGDRF